jgi:phosphoglycolate phosphatase
MYKALIFDLDGTLLDTITDITEAINEALKECGYQYSYDRESTKTLIGDGSDTLVRRALREKSGDVDAFSKLNRVYMPLYLEYQNRHTKPFPGIVEALEELKKAGVDCFIVSNKPDHLVQDLIPRYFKDGLFKECHGIKNGESVKPDPHQVNRIIEKWEIKCWRII